ncbi:MAG TPA: hypothetical protein PKY81_07980 [bacterium]|nr:hypothetical protein [bacterium]
MNFFFKLVIQLCLAVLLFTNYAFGGNLQDLKKKTSIKSSKFLMLEIPEFDHNLEYIVFINDEKPVKITSSIQIVYYQSNENNNHIKIDMVIPGNNKFKNKIYFIPSNTIQYKLKLNSRITQSQKDLIKSLVETVCLMRGYLNTGENFELINDNLKLLSDFDLLLSIFESIKNIDNEEFTEIINEVVSGLSIPSESIDKTAKSILRIIPKITGIISEYKNMKALSRSETNKKALSRSEINSESSVQVQDSLKLNASYKMFWNLFQLAQEAGNAYSGVKEIISEYYPETSVEE